MASGQFAVVYRQISRLFRSGTVAGLNEGQLLDRFVAGRDDAAFEAILSRHGPMVLGVCQSILRDSNDVEDAFQATFLVLVKKADSLRNRDLLGNWLYGVAHRVAKRARIEVAKRRDRQPIGPEPSELPVHDFDLRHLIHDEVDRLPQSYREAIILCYLEGRTHEEAARELGWPVGTVRGRLARARDLLRSRLSRHGLPITSGTIVATLTKQAEAIVPLLLLESTRLASASFISGRITTTFVISTRVISLAQGGLHTMSTTRIKLGVTLLVAVALSGPGVSAFQGSDSGQPATGKNKSQEKKGGDFSSINNQAQKASIKAGATPSISAFSGRASAESRIKLAQEAILTLESMKRTGEVAVVEPQMLRWQRRLVEAQFDQGIDTSNAANRYVELAKATERSAKTQFESGQVSKLDYLNAQFDLAEAEKFVSEAVGKKAPPAPAASTNNPPPGLSPQGNLMAGDTPRLRKLPSPNPADADRNKVIEQKLEMKLAMPFAEATSLEDILKYIRTNTIDEKLDFPNGIPIYVDPFVLVDNSDDPPKPKTLKTFGPLDLEGIPLRVTLRLVLDQFSLAYQVRDQMIYIMDEELLDMLHSGGFLSPPSNPNLNGGMTGMMRARGMMDAGMMGGGGTTGDAVKTSKKQQKK